MSSGCSEEDDDVVHELDKIVETYAADPEKKRALFRKLGIEDHAAGSPLVGSKAMLARRGVPLVGCTGPVCPSGNSLLMLRYLTSSRHSGSRLIIMPHRARAPPQV